jgi:hypothetical protein
MLEAQLSGQVAARSTPRRNFLWVKAAFATVFN